LSGATAKQIAEDVRSRKRSGDITVISIHWGSNWGYDISGKEKAFAHTLIDLGACDILHGHSSHHARPIEIYEGKLILYGCGDFINDYEGISDYERYRGDLSVMYLPCVDSAGGELESLALLIFQMHRFRLRYASATDVKWFQSVMSREGRLFGTKLSLVSDSELKAEWGSA
jgi:poly-gamma-glutamate synthesis protein (capsule biosynthesis protein)